MTPMELHDQSGTHHKEYREQDDEPPQRDSALVERVRGTLGKDYVHALSGLDEQADAHQIASQLKRIGGNKAWNVLALAANQLPFAQSKELMDPLRALAYNKHKWTPRRLRALEALSIFGDERAKMELEQYRKEKSKQPKHPVVPQSTQRQTAPEQSGRSDLRQAS